MQNTFRRKRRSVSYFAFNYVLIGNVGINTSNASEALSIHGNIQMTGAILQPSDLRIKKVCYDNVFYEQCFSLKNDINTNLFYNSTSFFFNLI